MILKKKYDCFMYSYEEDVVLARMEILYPFVDFFVVCESETTHLGDKKPLFFQENIKKFDKFKDKIVHKVIKLSGNGPWERENEQRYRISKILKELDPAPQDLIFMSDADECPDPQKFNEIRGEPYYFFAQLYFIYYCDLFSGKVCTGTSVCSWENLQSLDQRYDGKGLQMLRQNKDFLPVIEGGWHYSYFGTPTTISQKSRSIAEGNNNPNLLKTSPEEIEKQRARTIETLSSPYSHRPLRKFSLKNPTQYLEYEIASRGSWISGNGIWKCFPDLPEEMLRKMMIPE